MEQKKSPIALMLWEISIKNMLQIKRTISKGLNNQEPQ